MSFAIYLIKVSIAILVFYMIYRIIFLRFTFFHFNRFYMLLAFACSFLLPFIRFPVSEAEIMLLDYTPGIDWDNLMKGGAVPHGPIAEEKTFPMVNLIWLFYAAVSLFRFLRVGGKYLIIRKRYNIGIVVRQNGIKWNLQPESISPFTMFRTVYIGREAFFDENSPLRSHEMVHARQLHSIDLLFAELICSFLWFHPVVFLFSRYMRDNHEYLADQVAHTDKQGLIDYMQLLSSELTRRYDPAFASYFQNSTLKKRIIMLTNKKSTGGNRWYYLIVIPVIGVLTLSFQQPLVRDMEPAPLVSLKSGNNGSFPGKSEPDIPSRFPLDEKYKTAVTFTYNKEANHPITGEMMTHKGIDFKAPRGTPVFATANGVIVTSEYHSRYGKLVIIKHQEPFVTLYAHLDDLMVAVGETVKIGQQIGTVGNTGLSTGSHLHYEVRQKEENVDPSNYY